MKLSPFTSRRHKNAGIAAVEFLFAAPAFFILVFFVVEVALVWNDRHIMRLAAYKAARAVVKTRTSQNISNSLCWVEPTAGTAEDPTSPDAQVHIAARRAAAKVMATVTPSVTQLLTMFHFGPNSFGHPLGTAFDSDIESNTQSVFGTVTDNVLNNPYVHAIARMMKGLPAAWLFTDLRCTNVQYPQKVNTVESNGVEITLIYHRSAKMPYVGNLMWVLKKMQDFANAIGMEDDGTSGMLRINPLNYGMEMNAQPNSPQLIATELKIRAMIVEKAAELGKKLSEKVDEKTSGILPSAVTGQAVPQIFGSIASSGFDMALQRVDEWRVASAVNWIGNQALTLLLMAPDEIKTIPVTVAVRVPNFNQAYAGVGKPWSGSAVMLGSLTNDDKIAKMSKKLAETLNEANPPVPPNEKSRLPYVKE